MRFAELTKEEIATVLRNEYDLRAYYKVRGELEESSLIIRKLKAKILLAVRERETAKRFFSLLEFDSKSVDFLKVYQAGKESRAAGETQRDGLYRCLRDMTLDPENLKFSAEFQHVFSQLIAMMPDEETSMYPEYLLTEYRATFGAVNQHIEAFFKLGYEAADPIGPSERAAVSLGGTAT